MVNKLGAAVNLKLRLRRYCIKNEIIRFKISEPCTYSAPEDGGHNRMNFSSFVDFFFLDRIHIGMLHYKQQWFIVDT